MLVLEFSSISKEMSFPLVAEMQTSKYNVFVAWRKILNSWRKKRTKIAVIVGIN